ncbi:ribonuclease P protein component [Thermanaerovibrio acidaminovorans DSM 6589]|uniref:Ribonuclease P protein component n=1 Tax=Thermanaerovibrio acidaminovorans (strain ATCC 49978 / DSM 6589 / Su883) TaxID=525903 RepID=D1B9I6_THEAS|nr:ribonuclease P protein component [Thermanaerovibrio acidaminovorans]ACZ18939.1 ribonuclease P protein component [Thermanaerovibrio acidaminovorans DSM 6589]
MSGTCHLPGRSGRSFPFPKDVRLRSGWEFDFVFRTGRRSCGELVRLFFVTSPDGTTKVGVTVGKKMAKAARRVRGRRCAREALRRLIPWIKDGVWLAVSMRERGLNATARDVYADLAALLWRNGLLSDQWPGENWEVDRG